MHDYDRDSWKQTRKALHRANRALRTINACNKALVRETVEQDLLEKICAAIVGLDGYRLAWVGYSQQDPDKSVRPMAWAGYEDAYLDWVQISWGDSATGRGPTGTAIRTGRPYCAQDIQIQPDYAPWRSEALKRGYASSLALPLLNGERVFGALTIYAQEPDAFDTEEKKLLQSLADNLAFGITALRTRQKREKAEKQLRESEEKFRMIFECSPLAIFHFDREGVITDCNDNLAAIFGIPKAELLGFNILNSSIDAEIHAPIETCLAGKRIHWEGYYYSRCVSRVIPLKADYGPILDRKGSLVGAIGILEDISARKEAEEALRESEQQLRSLSTKLLTAQEEERKRITGELHDSIGSSLTGIKFRLEQFCNQCPEDFVEPLENLITITGRATDELRAIMNALRPSMLDDLGLNATVAWFCREYQTLYPAISVHADFHFDESMLPETIKTSVFRIIQEAFNNIAKYARAERVDLTLRDSDEAFELLIEDNGIGFDPGTLSSLRDQHRGIGLSSMRKRAELSGGSLSIRSADGKGTVVQASWPLRSRVSF